MIIIQLVQVALLRNEQGCKSDFEKNKIKYIEHIVLPGRPVHVPRQPKDMSH